VLSLAPKGEVVAVAHRSVPSHQYSTFTTPTLSEADTVRLMVPLTVLPALGDIRVTAGGVVSAPADVVAQACPL